MPEPEPTYPTPSQQALYVWWLGQRYAEQLRLFGWDPPSSVAGPPEPELAQPEAPPEP